MEKEEEEVDTGGELYQRKKTDSRHDNDAGEQSQHQGTGYGEKPRDSQRVEIHRPCDAQVQTPFH